MKRLLLGEKKQLENETKVFKKDDPFMDEAIEGRNIDEQGDEVLEQQQREITDAMTSDIKGREEEVEDALERIEKGKYGLSVESGKPIQKERLETDPAAELTAEEARKKEEKKRPRI